VLQRIPTITTMAAARAAAEGIQALQRNTITVNALQSLHSAKAVASSVA
jgi:carbamoyl-phosphate synthase large subunit